MKVIYESDPRSIVHYLSSSENKAWKKLFGTYIMTRALHRYRKGHGFKSRTGLNFFRPYFHYWLSSIQYCADHFHIHDVVTVDNLRLRLLSAASPLPKGWSRNIINPVWRVSWLVKASNFGRFNPVSQHGDLSLQEGQIRDIERIRSGY